MLLLSRARAVSARRVDSEREYQAMRRKQEEFAELEYVQRTEGQQAREALQRAFEARVAGRPYASWGRRVVARVVDTLIVVAIALAAFALDKAVAGLVLLLLPFLYFPLFHAYANGQTPGKKLLGIAVHRTQGLRFGRALWRTLAEALLGIIPLVDPLWALIDGRNQTLHDKAAGTVVIRTASLTG